MSDYGHSPKIDATSIKNDQVKTQAIDDQETATLVDQDELQLVKAA
jgi:hypothetical protein